MNTTSASLLERLRQPHAGDAWDRFVKLYTPLLYYWARQGGLQQDDAADLVQDVFLVLVRKLPEFCYDGPGCFRAWLRKVTLNKLRDQCKQRVPDLLGSAIADVDVPAEADEVALFEEEEYRQHLTAGLWNWPAPSSPRKPGSGSGNTWSLASQPLRWQPSWARPRAPSPLPAFA